MTATKKVALVTGAMAPTTPKNLTVPDWAEIITLAANALMMENVPGLSNLGTIIRNGAGSCPITISGRSLDGARTPKGVTGFLPCAHVVYTLEHQERLLFACTSEPAPVPYLLDMRWEWDRGKERGLRLTSATLQRRELQDILSMAQNLPKFGTEVLKSLAWEQSQAVTSLKAKERDAYRNARMIIGFLERLGVVKLK